MKIHISKPKKSIDKEQNQAVSVRLKLRNTFMKLQVEEKRIPHANSKTLFVEK